MGIFASKLNKARKKIETDPRASSSLELSDIFFEGLPIVAEARKQFTQGKKELRAIEMRLRQRDKQTTKDLKAGRGTHVSRNEILELQKMLGEAFRLNRKMCDDAGDLPLGIDRIFNPDL